MMKKFRHEEVILRTRKIEWDMEHKGEHDYNPWTQKIGIATQEETDNPYKRIHPKEPQIKAYK